MRGGRLSGRCVRPGAASATVCLLAICLSTLGLPAGCARGVRPEPGSPPLPPIRPAGAPSARAAAGLSGDEIGRALADAGIEHETREPGRRWMAVFGGRRLPRVVLYVVRGDDFTVLMGRLFTVSAKTGPGFYRALARHNFDYDQLKFSVDAGGGVFASLELPTRLLDRQALLESLYALAVAVDALVPQLLRDAGLEDLPEALPEDPPLRPHLPDRTEASLPRSEESRLRAASPAARRRSPGHQARGHQALRLGGTPPGARPRGRA